MVMTDPIVDYLTRIRNANMAKHGSAEILASSVKKSLSEILKNEGLIRDYQVEDDNEQDMTGTFLKYGPNNERAISGLKRISRPDLRNYVSARNLPKVLNSLGTVIIPTPVGVITDKGARGKNADDEVIAYAW